MAQGFSDAGVPVFAADVKGDLSGIAMPGAPNEKLLARAAGHGPDADARRPRRRCSGTCSARRATRSAPPSREMGPLLLARMLDLNDVQEGVLTVVFHVADEEGLLLLDLDDLRAMLAYVGENAKRIGREVGNVAPASIATIQRELLSAGAPGRRGLLRRAGAAARRHDAHRRSTAGARSTCWPPTKLIAQPAPLRHLPAVAAVGAVRGAARGRRPGQAAAGLLLRRGPPAVQRRARRRCWRRSSRSCA